MSTNIIFANNLVIDASIQQEWLDILYVARNDAYNYLSSFRNDAGYTEKLQTAFGDDFDGEVANQLFDGFAQGNFSAVPTIEIVNRNDINGANGAFSKATGKIYLAADFISQNAQNLDAIVAVLLEETGHSIDAQINTVDTAGDEGDVFARLVQGKSISQQELAVLRADDDTATVTLDGQVVEIEQNNLGTGNVHSYWDSSWSGTVWTNDENSGVIDGSDQDDWLRGFGGNDTIYGNGGNDRIDGGNDSDNVNGGNGNDLLYGGSGNDTLWGNAGNDSLDGGSENDVLVDWEGSNLIDGGDGWDVVSYDGSNDAVTIGENARERQPNINGNSYVAVIEAKVNGEISSLANIEQLTGSKKDDILYARGASANTGYTSNTVELKQLRGGDGNDQLFALGDRLNPGQSNELFGDAGNDILTGDIAKDGRTQNLYGGSGFDTFILAASSDNAKSTSSKIFETLEGIAIDALGFIPGYGDILSFIGSAVNSLYGTLSDAGDIPGSGDDLVYIADFTLGEDVIVLPELNGTESYHLLTSSGRNNEFYIQVKAASESDFRNIARVTVANPLGSGYSSAMDLSMLLGKSFDISQTDYTIGDVVVYDDSKITSGQTNITTHHTDDSVSGSQNNDAIQTLGGNDTLNGNAGNDTLDGGDGNDSLIGGAGNDSLIGGAGNDTLIGGAGNDTLNGGDGEDTADYSTATPGINVTLASGSVVQNDGFGNQDTLYGIDHVIGGAGNDTIVGDNNWNNTLNGGAGNDSLNGLGGNDTLIGGAGNDTLIGGAGNDTLDGGAGNDKVIFTGNSNEYKFSFDASKRLTITDQTANRDDQDTVTQSEEIKFTDRDFYSSDFNEDFYRLVHEDVDRFIRDNPNMISSGFNHYQAYGQNEGRVTNFNFDEQYYRSMNPDVNTASSGLDDYITSGRSQGRVAAYNALNSNDPLWGTSKAEFLIGANGNNVIQGREGNDTLIGGAGNDTLDGGAGYDKVILTGKSTEYKFSFDALGRLTITDLRGSGDGQDTVTQSEEIKFSDRVYYSSDFNEQFYRLVHPDVDNFIKNYPSMIPSGVFHYKNWGQNEGRVTNFNFDEQYYRQKNPDVDAAITNTPGVIPSALYHYINWGKAEIATGNPIRFAPKYNALNSDDPLWGTPNAEILEGSNGNNSIQGREGNDTLIGGAGKDTLAGGVGSDSFDYRNLTDSLLNNFDVITDFNAAEDKFLVSTTRDGSLFNAGSVASNVATDIGARLTTTNFGANYAAQFTVGSDTYVAINDATAGFNASADAIIKVTGYTGTLSNIIFTTV